MKPTLLTLSALVVAGMLGSQRAETDKLGAIEVYASGDVQFLVTDPLGRRAGIDPETGAEWSESPGEYSVWSLGYDDGSARSTPPIQIF